MDNLELHDKLMARHRQLLKAIADARQEMQENSQTLIEQATAELFRACPEVQQLHWTQYTPYFNDGDSCEFSVNGICFLLKDDLDEDDEWDEEYYEGSSITTIEDVDDAKKDLKSAELWEKDPWEWRLERFGSVAVADLKKWVEDNPNHPTMPSWNLPYNYRAKPYPDNVADAQRRLDKVVAKYDRLKDRGDTIRAHVKAVTDFIGSIPDDVMENLYGDHVAVKIDRDGTHVDEYSHD